ncbi:hypothetical protein MMC17_008001 [Xylographa soralifera]|nr:hypothetical protein [Xylographa soralifera]
MPGRDLNLLALDGGGIRGLSSLHILKQLMESVCREAGLDTPPKPCDYFDMIGGTSTGGLIAIMLGRLKMTVDECIDAYADLSDRVFRKRHHRVSLRDGSIQGRFDSQELERATKQIIVRSGFDENELLRDIPDATCKVFVCATSPRTSEIVHLTSYRRPRGGGDRLNAVKIWEAARATSAASSFFDPVTINMGTYTEDFIDGATGANNPVQELWNEAKDVWDPEPLDRNLKSLVSIGTGVPSVEPFRTGLLEIGQTLIRISTETEQTAESFQRAHSELDDSDRYFRFNVRNGLEHIGLEDSSQKNAIMTLTERYVESQDTFKLLKRCGNGLAERELSSKYVLFDRLETQNSLILPETRPVQRHVRHKPQRDILARVSLYGHEKVHRRLSNKRLKGSGNWFLEHADFQAWLNGLGNRYLWCSGIVGSGKTMIATAVVEAVKDKSRKSGNAVAYFYCESAQQEFLQASNLLESLIKQGLMYLASIQKPCPDSVRKKLEELYRYGGPERDIEDIAEIFSGLFYYLKAATYIIDGLDEFEHEEINHVLRIFRDLLSNATQQKLYLSSRKELHHAIDIAHMLPNTTQILMSQSDSLEDIRLYIETKIADQSRKLTDNAALIEDVKSQLLNRAHGMFLWVRLQIEALWEGCFTDNDIRNALDDLPHDLDSTYRRCLDRIKRYGNIDHAVKVFKWLGCASRPLHIDELKEALAFTLEDRAWHAGRTQTTKLIIGRCANLVILDTADQRVRFAHHSVQRYLSEPGEQSSEFRIMHQKGQLECGEFCINYLTFSDFGIQLQKHSNKSVVLPSNIGSALAASTNNTAAKWIYKATGIMMQKPGIPLPTRNTHLLVPHLLVPTEFTSAIDTSKFGFLSYATENWVNDTRFIQTESRIWPSFRSLAISPNSSLKIHPWPSGGQSYVSHLHGLLGWSVRKRHMPLLELFLSLGPEYRIHELCNKPLVEDGLPALHLASRLGYENIVILLLPICSVNDKDHQNRTPLYYASEKGHAGVVRMLLKIERTKIDGKDVNIRNSLYVSSEQGHSEIVGLLLQYGAKPDLKDKDDRTPLSWAAGQGHKAVVAQLLANPRVDPNSKDNGGWTPLLWAAKRGHEAAVAQLLADPRVDPNSKDNSGWTPLHWAADQGHEAAVAQLLADPRVDPNSKDNSGWTPLHWAADKGQEAAVAQLLADPRVDPNSKANSGWTPLHWAANQGQEAAVAQLLADPRVDPNSKDNGGQTPLHWAADQGHEAVVAQLNKAPNILINLSHPPHPPP